ncbi:MAG TPA: LysR family transcriptional regulator [Pseudogracilibacillus sp.]|nr:LysR family transcriptional regulator [Pseudogracilibacillus sp.]
MKIDDYALLLQLEKIGTVRGTAKAVLISQPAVSQRLKFIEDYFEEQIFIRTSKRLKLTPSGEMIVKHAQEVIEREKDLKNKLAASSTEVRGTLSIGCSSVVSQRYLPEILAKFTKRYPQVSIDLVTGLSEHLIREHTKYHVTIIRGDKLKDNTSVLLFKDPLYIFDTEPFNREKGKARPLISFKSDDSLHDLMNDWLVHQQGNIHPIQKISVDQIETCKQFMKQGLGMAILPKSVSRVLMDKYPHLPLEVEGEAITRDTWLCYKKGVRNLPQVNRFIELLLNESFD